MQILPSSMKNYSVDSFRQAIDYSTLKWQIGLESLFQTSEKTATAQWRPIAFSGRKQELPPRPQRWIYEVKRNVFPVDRAVPNTASKSRDVNPLQVSRVGNYSMAPLKIKAGIRFQCLPRRGDLHWTITLHLSPSCRMQSRSDS